MYCTKCGAKASDAANYCWQCGFGLTDFGLDSDIHAPSHTVNAIHSLADSSVADQMPGNVRGWLLVLVIALIFLAPIDIAWRSFDIYKKTAWAADSRNHYENAFVLFALVAGIGCIWSGLRLAYRREPGTITIAKIGVWIAGLGKALMIYWILPQAARTEYDGNRHGGLAGIIGILVGSLAFSLVWHIYLNRSKRVAETYVLIAEYDSSIDHKPFNAMIACSVGLWVLIAILLIVAIIASISGQT